MAKTSKFVVELKLSDKAVIPLTTLIETLVRNRAALPGECIAALDAFEADAKSLASLFVTETKAD